MELRRQRDVPGLHQPAEEEHLHVHLELRHRSQLRAGDQVQFQRRGGLGRDQHQLVVLGRVGPRQQLGADHDSGQRVRDRVSAGRRAGGRRGADCDPRRAAAGGGLRGERAGTGRSQLPGALSRALLLGVRRARRAQGRRTARNAPLPADGARRVLRGRLGVLLRLRDGVAAAVGGRVQEINHGTFDTMPYT